MKKKISGLIFSLSIIFSTLITAFAESDTAIEETAKIFDLQTILDSFIKSPSAVTVMVISFALILVFAVFRKKIYTSLDNSSAKKMTNAFIAFFSVSGIICLALAFATEGATWSNMMHVSDGTDKYYAQFENYIVGVKSAGTKNFSKTATVNTPFAQMIYLFLAQFLPTKLIRGESLVQYSSILRNQTFMFLYLILILFVVVLIYRMSRIVLSNNKLTLRNEIIAFMLAFSFPAIFCFEKGSITVLLSFVLTLVFTLFRNDKKTQIRELSYAAIAASAAITPYTLIFAVFLLENKSIKAILRFTRTILYFIVLFIAPATLTGAENLSAYMNSLISVSAEGFIPGNMSIANLFHFLGIHSIPVIYAVGLLTGLIALIAMFVLPATWQKAAAAVYTILNIYAVSDAVAMIFVFIPFIFLLAEKEHKPINWLYLLSFAMMITPLPEWFLYDANFHTFLASMNIDNIRNANNLIVLAAAQCIFIAIFCQAVSKMKEKKSKKAVKQAEQQINA